VFGILPLLATIMTTGWNIAEEDDVGVGSLDIIKRRSYCTKSSFLESIRVEYSL